MAKNDPATFFRDMLGQWEKMANSFGNDAMRTEEFARGLQGASAATVTMQGALRDVTEKALAAANLPTRSDFDALAARVAGIEAALFRIEAKLGEVRPGDATAASLSPLPPEAATPPESGGKKKPTRGRKPPKSGAKD